MTHGTVAQPHPPGPCGYKPSRHWAILPQAFTPTECAELQQLLNALETQEGGLVAGRFDAKIRRSALMWLPDDTSTQWAHTRLARLIGDANRDTFHYQLDGFEEQVQLAAYGPDHYYDWHIDRGQGATAGRRKLTLSIQLTAPDQYTGGDLELNATGRPMQMPREQGTAVIFAAHTVHRVAPVISGMRHSLVAWVHGPDFI